MTVDEPLDYLRAAHAATQAEAEAATSGPWWYNPGKQWLDPEAFERYDLRRGQEFVGYGGPHPFTGAIAATGPANDPAAVLRRIAAERALLDDLLAERHLVIEGDCWYTCRAATEDHDGGENCNDTERGKPCDCGRDDRVNRRVRIMAEGWGWTPAS